MAGSAPRLAGKVAVVTGASRGLGRAIAVALGREGASVAVVARTEAVWDERLPGTVHETVQAVEAAGGKAMAVPADLADEAALVGLVETVHGGLGPVDVLVNNAAVTIGGRPPTPGSPTPGSTAPVRAAQAVSQDAPPSFLDFPLKAYRLHTTVNVFAAYRLMQLLLPDMVARGAGAVVNVSSDAAFKPGEGPYPHERAGVPTLFAYGSTKAALHTLTQAVAVEFAPQGIAVNALLPSLPIPTPGSVSLLAGHEVERWATAEDFAAAAVELALADPAERTGQILFHDDVLHPELGRRGFLTDPI